MRQLLQKHVAALDRHELVQLISLLFIVNKKHYSCVWPNSEAIGIILLRHLVFASTVQSMCRKEHKTFFFARLQLLTELCIATQIPSGLDNKSAEIFTFSPDPSFLVILQFC